MEMLKGRSMTIEFLDSLFDKVDREVGTKHVPQVENEVIDFVIEESGFPSEKVAPIVIECFSKGCANASDEMLLRLMSYFDKRYSTEKLKEYFSERDINRAKKEKYVAPDVKGFQIEPIKCVKVAEDQFIGVLPHAPAFFKTLRADNIIRYNTETQRPMTPVTKNGETTYKITVSNKAISEIRENCANGDFISNTITLNVDPSDDTEFIFDEKSSTLKFKNLICFDITDGFHRYRALCQEKDANPEFDYPMEIRITRFDREKAAYFVWQEDQKVPMNKKEVRALNTKSMEMKIIDYIIGRRGFLSDKIDKEGTLIRTTDFISCLNEIFVKKYEREFAHTPAIKRDYITDIGRAIDRTFNVIEEDYLREGKDIFDFPMNELQLFVILKLIQMEQTPAFIAENFKKIEEGMPSELQYNKKGNTYRYNGWIKEVEEYCDLVDSSPVVPMVKLNIEKTLNNIMNEPENEWVPVGEIEMPKNRPNINVQIMKGGNKKKKEQPDLLIGNRKVARHKLNHKGS